VRISRLLKHVFRKALGTRRVDEPEQGLVDGDLGARGPVAVRGAVRGRGGLPSCAGAAQAPHRLLTPSGRPGKSAHLSMGF